METIGIDKDNLHMLMAIPPKYSIAAVLCQINYPSATSKVLEQRQLTIFKQHLVFFATLLFNVIAYRALVSMFADSGPKITICPKLTAQENVFHLRAALENFSCREAL